MSDVTAHFGEGLTTRQGQPLIGVPTLHGAEEVIRYFASEEDADRALADGSAGIERVLRLAGAWEHLDADDGPDMLDELDRIRHESRPTPPLEL